MASVNCEFTKERRELICRLSKATKIQEIDRASHAMLWLSDLEMLNFMVQEAESGVLRANYIGGSLLNENRTMRAMKSWLARPGGPGKSSLGESEEPEQPEEPTELAALSEPEPAPAPAKSSKSHGKRKSKGEESGSPSKTQRRTGPDRADTPKGVVSKRDKDLCVITKAGEPIQICHIYPISLGNKPESERAQFWSLLGLFWSPTTISKWQNDIFGPNGTEVPQNLLCLSILVHQLWGMARLALEPVGESRDKTSLTVRFWWLPRGKLSKVPMRVAPILPDKAKASPYNTKLWDCVTDKPIYSGHLVTMTTRDPVAQPLPSFELLRMQWILNRVAPVCGAADVTDEELEDDIRGSGGTVLGSVA